MFSEILQATLAVLKSLLTSPSTESDSAALDATGGSSRQLQYELALATQTPTMVATRSQEPHATNDGLDDSFTANGTPKVQLKRKLEEGGNGKASEARKRRKSATDFFDGDAVDENGTSLPSGKDKAVSETSEPPFDMFAADDDIHLDPEEQHILSTQEVEEIKAKPEISVVISPHKHTMTDVEDPAISPEKRKTSSPKPEQSNALLSDEVPAVARASPTPKASHKRFDSVEPDEELLAPEQEPSPAQILDDDVPNDSDSDDAPETTTLTAATADAQATQKLADEAARKQQEQKRQKARAREEAQRLHREKVEAKALKKEKKAKKREELASAVDLEVPLENMSPPLTGSTTLKGSPVHEGHGRFGRMMEIPKVLPMSLLSSVPAVRSPTPPLEAPSNMELSAAGTQRKHTAFIPKQKRPKDIVKNGVRIRVLAEDESKGTLAPKADKQSMSIRERWLSGRGMVERRPWQAASKNFVRTR